MSKSNKQTPSKKAVSSPYQFPNSSKLWHDSQAATPLIGCDGCHYRAHCGGLQVGAHAFDCMAFCTCTDVSLCDNVCPRNLEHFVARFLEVGGVSLGNIPRVQRGDAIALPAMIPMVYHSSARMRAPSASVVALSLYELLDKRTGDLRFGSREALCDRFMIDTRSMIVLSGTDIDPPLERWWRLADRGRRARELAALGIKLITSPNYSLFDDVPRFDNMYNMKRIAVASAEIQEAGIHCAVHLNARTDRDWNHWIEYLKERPEYEFVAFEFGTGAGAETRVSWHIAQLSRLAAEVQRPLNLLVRGGLDYLGALSASFVTLSFVDTGAFVRAQRRRRGRFAEGTGLIWEKALTPRGQPIDDLLDDNILAMESRVRFGLREKHRPLVHLPGLKGATNHTCEEALEVRSLA